MRQLTLDELDRKIESAEDLKSVVKTMKALASVNIRQYEKAAESLENYNKTIQMGLQIVIKSRVEVRTALTQVTQPGKYLGAIVFGSERGLSGKFNNKVVSFAVEKMNEMNIAKSNRTVLALGERIIGHLEDEGESVSESISYPNSITGITNMVREILLIIENWRFQQQIQQIFLFYNKRTSASSYQPEMLELLPIDLNWLKKLKDRDWPTHVLPTFTMDWEQLFSSLVRQYFFVSLFRSIVESLESENASRLAAMQAAEKNIEEKLDELNTQYHHQRQSSITSELLDIVGGFEALRSREGK